MWGSGTLGWGRPGLGREGRSEKDGAGRARPLPGPPVPEGALECAPTGRGGARPQPPPRCSPKLSGAAGAGARPARGGLPRPGAPGAAPPGPGTAGGEGRGGCKPGAARPATWGSERRAVWGPRNRPGRPGRGAALAPGPGGRAVGSGRRGRGLPGPEMLRLWPLRGGQGPPRWRERPERELRSREVGPPRSLPLRIRICRRPLLPACLAPSLFSRWGGWSGPGAVMCCGEGRSRSPRLFAAGGAPWPVSSFDT